MVWDHLRTFEAVARLGSMTAASRAFRVSQSTVSRHLRSLEKEAGSPLFFRESPLRLTQRGTALLKAVLPMVDGALAAHSALEETLELCGEVIVTTVGEIVRWTLSKRLPSFFQAFPGLRLHILANNQLNSLAAGEADVALRFVRPERGELIAQKLHTESYGLFVSSLLDLQPDVPWLGLAGSLAMIPEQRYAERAFAMRSPRLLLEDVETLGLAVESGLGVAVLPRGFGARLSGVVEVCARDIGARDLGPVPSRDLWMVVHQSRQNLPKVRAVMQWLEESFSGGETMGTPSNQRSSHR